MRGKGNAKANQMQIYFKSVLSFYRCSLSDKKQALFRRVKIGSLILIIRLSFCTFVK